MNAQTTAYHALTILQRASLQDLLAARANARRWSSAATVAALTLEINRRLGN